MYGVDLWDLGTARLSPSFCSVLIGELPPSAPLNRHLRPARADWSILNDQLANINDAANRRLTQAAMLAGAKGQKWPEPSWRPEHYEADQRRLRAAERIEDRLREQSARMRAKRERRGHG